MKIRNSKFEIINAKSGFTLLEMLVSLVIFMIFVGVAASSYTSLVKSEKVATESQKLFNSVRAVFDAISDELRTGEIAYSCNGDDAFADSFCTDWREGRSLGILHNNGLRRVIFKYNETEKVIVRSEQSRQPIGPNWGPASEQVLTDVKFPLTNASFRIFPLENPYSSSSYSEDKWQYQPSVTININTEKYNFRTTYSSRFYGTK